MNAFHNALKADIAEKVELAVVTAEGSKITSRELS